HAADRRGGGNQIACRAGDGAPRGIAAIRDAADADPPALGDAGVDQRLDPGADVVLLAPAPAVLLDRLAEFDTVAGAAAVVGIEDVEAAGNQKLDRRVDLILAVKGRAAMDPQHGTQRRPLRPVE